MIRTSSTLRRAGLAVAMAGVATFGAVALAPAASASLALGGSTSVISGPGLSGPVAFLVTDQGVSPIFFCDPANPLKWQNVCQADPTTATDRF